MDYFIIKQLDTVVVNHKDIKDSEEATICKLDDISKVRGIDFIAKDGLISESLKQLFELYCPKNIWKPFVYMDVLKVEQEAFWYL